MRETSITQDDLEFIIQLGLDGFVLNTESTHDLEFDWYPDFEGGLFNDGGEDEYIEVILMGSPATNWHAWAKSTKNRGHREVALQYEGSTTLDIIAMVTDSKDGYSISQVLREALYTCPECGNPQNYEDAWDECFSSLGFAGHICKECDADGSIRNSVEWYDSRTGRSWNA